MNRHDLLELKKNIYLLGETVNEQEGFYRDVNGFLRQMYPKLSNKAPMKSARSRSYSLAKTYWTAPSAGERPVSAS